MSQRTFVSDTNPNVEVGGGGCIGSGETHSEDCKGPFVIFPQSETSSNISPHVVLCARCLEEAQKELKAFDPESEVVTIAPEDIVEETEEIPEV